MKRFLKIDLNKALDCGTSTDSPLYYSLAYFNNSLIANESTPK